MIGPVPKSMDDMKKLRSLGIICVISLLETDYEIEPQWANGLRMQYERFPIEDFGVPTFELVQQILDYIDARTEPVYVHCFMGLGRAGTIAACYLVRGGMEPQEAIDEVRKKRPGSLQTKEQEEFIYNYSKFLESIV